MNRLHVYLTAGGLCLALGLGIVQAQNPQGGQNQPNNQNNQNNNQGGVKTFPRFVGGYLGGSFIGNQPTIPPQMQPNNPLNNPNNPIWNQPINPINPINPVWNPMVSPIQWQNQWQWQNPTWNMPISAYPFNVSPQNAFQFPPTSPFGPVNNTFATPYSERRYREG